MTRPCMNPRSVLFADATPARVATADAACNNSNPPRVSSVDEMIRVVNAAAGSQLIWRAAYDSARRRYAFFWDVIDCVLVVDSVGACLLWSDVDRETFDIVTAGKAERFGSLSRLTAHLIRELTPPPPLTLARVVAELRAFNVVCKRTGEGRELRVNFRNGGEATAYYTDDLADALGTGRAMAERVRRVEAR